jgi:hypothetical protein
MSGASELVRRVRHLSLLCAVFAMMATASPVHAQQFVTDDAALVERGACQLEAWYARPASWILPACQVIPNLEVTAGLGAVETVEGAHDVRYVLQGKTLFRELEPDGFGIGLVGGFGLDPLGQIVARRIDSMYAYVPLSVSLAGDAMVLHQNVGWVYGPEPGENGVAGRRHALTWAMRADVGLTDRWTAIAELFGQSRVFPEYQVGLRWAVVPDRLGIDLSYSGATAGDARGAFTAGLAWTPPPWR